MNYDKHIQALKAVNRALNEEHRAECLAQFEYYEARGDVYGAEHYRKALAEVDASLAKSS